MFDDLRVLFVGLVLLFVLSSVLSYICAGNLSLMFDFLSEFICVRGNVVLEVTHDFFFVCLFCHGLLFYNQLLFNLI